ncbi:hypothetical protein [Microbacterium aerolatum]|uniref:hypothetical protein n=1 Tax=Microbacterium aerolatum TaxID=153731 RepID=UPI00384A94BA
MATVTLSFTLSDFGWVPLEGLFPRVRFVPTDAGVQGSRLMPDKPVYATVNPTTGAGTVTLSTTHDILPSGVGYRIQIDWLMNPADPEPKYWAEWPQVLYLVPGVTDLGQILGKEVRNDMVYVGADADRSDLWTGFQYNPVTGNIYQRIG